MAGVAVHQQYIGRLLAVDAILARGQEPAASREREWNMNGNHFGLRVRSQSECRQDGEHTD
jgi:hypothetical protein